MKPSRVRAAGGSTGRLDAQSWDLQTRTDSDLPPRRCCYEGRQGVPPWCSPGQGFSGCRAKMRATRAVGVTRVRAEDPTDSPPVSRQARVRCQGMDHYCGEVDPVMDPYLTDMGDYLYEDDGDGIEPTDEDC